MNENIQKQLGETIASIRAKTKIVPRSASSSAAASALSPTR